MTSSPSTFMSCNDSEPPFLAIGTDVSAKYKGAFCEAKIKKVTRLVKCRVTFKNNGGSVIVTDDNIKGPLRVGSLIEAKHPDKSQYLEGTINKIIDASQYTVVFDDGDETTLRRTSLCLKSGKHFAESESLDHLPLTNPEHFGNPVNLGSVKSRRKRNAPVEREKRDDTPNSISDDRNIDEHDDDDSKKSLSTTIGRRGKRRGKYSRKPRTKPEAEGEDDADRASNENNEDVSPPANVDSETESDNEYDSTVSNNYRQVNSAHNVSEERIKCETESMEASPASGTTESYSSFTSFKSRRKRNMPTDCEKKDDIIKAEPSETYPNDDDDKKASSVSGRKGKRRGKFGRKRIARNGPDEDEADNIDDKGSGANNDSDSESEAEYDSKIPNISPDVCVEVDDRIRVKYGKGKVVKIYEAKVLKSDNASDLLKRKFYVHYTGWNTRYDEWIKRNRIVEVIREKIAKRKGGSKFKKGIAPNQRHTSSPDREESPKEQSKEKDSKDSNTTTTKSITSIKRGRPSSASDAKLNDAGKNGSGKAKAPGKRRFRPDHFDANNHSSESANNNSPAANVKSIEHDDNENGSQSDHEATLAPCSNEHQNSINEIKGDDKSAEQSVIIVLASCKTVLEESTDIDTMEVAAETELKEEIPKPSPAEDTLEEKVKVCPVSNLEDILTCNENLAKSPPMRPLSPEITEMASRDSPKVDVKTEKVPVHSPAPEENESEEDESKSTTKPGKRKLVGKHSFRKDKKQLEDDDNPKNTEDIQSRKKLFRKRKDEPQTNDEEESKKDLKSLKKTRKSNAPTQESSSTSVTADTDSLEVPKVNLRYVTSIPKDKEESISDVPAPNDAETESDRKGKKRKRCFGGKTKQSELTVKTDSNPSFESKNDGQMPKKKLKRDSKEKKKRERVKERGKDSPELDEQHEDESQEVACLFENKNLHDQSSEDQALGDMTCNDGLQKAGGLFLLCKEEVPASPPGHHIDLLGKLRETSSSHLKSCSVDENGRLNASASHHHTAASSSSSVALQPVGGDVKENGDHHGSSIANRDCTQFTPPTTPESLKSGTLSSSTPPHDRESSDNERNQNRLHHLAGEQSFSSSAIDIAKAEFASAISALDSLASAASTASKKCNLSPAYNLDDSCSRNDIFDGSNKGDKLSSACSPLSSPKKRRGRVRTSSTSETNKETKSHSGYKTRGACGRKTKQYGDSNDIYSSHEPSGPISPAFPSISITNYSPNAFVYSVFPTSKYNFCTPIDENLEPEKRIQILLDRLQDLRKTYMNVKANVATIERKKKAKKKDKDSNSPISPSSSSHHEPSASRNPKDHPPEILGSEGLQSQSCAA